MSDTHPHSLLITQHPWHTCPLCMSKGTTCPFTHPSKLLIGLITGSNARSKINPSQNADIYRWGDSADATADRQEDLRPRHARQAAASAFGQRMEAAPARRRPPCPQRILIKLISSCFCLIISYITHEVRLTVTLANRPAVSCADQATSTTSIG